MDVEEANALVDTGGAAVSDAVDSNIVATTAVVIGSDVDAHVVTAGKEPPCALHCSSDVHKMNGVRPPCCKEQHTAGVGLLRQSSIPVLVVRHALLNVEAVLSSVFG